jgi:DNA-directed RNA polymerase subunit M/transcription elongation factor TFIIS
MSDDIDFVSDIESEHEVVEVNEDAEEEESDAEEEDYQSGEEGDDVADNLGDEDDEPIQIEEFEDAPVQKKAVSFRNRRKKITRAVTKRKGVVVDNRTVKAIGDDIRKSGVDLIREYTTEKNAVIVEKGVYNCALRSAEKRFNRQLLPEDVQGGEYNDIYTDILYDTLTELARGVKCSEQLSRIRNDTVGLLSPHFSDEIQVDLQQTNNIENPPRPKPGVHRCNKCFYDKSLKDDAERGKRTWYYELQTRSSDEPMTQFVTCLDCGFKWKQ